MDPTQKGLVYQQVRDALRSENPELLQAAAGAEVGAGGGAAPGALTADGRLSPLLRSQGVLQVHKSYLVTQDQEGILIVDQHALHERVMFEDLRQRVLEKPLESQRLLMPAVVEAGARRQALAQQLRPLLERIGIDLTPLGPGSLGVHAFPSFLFDRKIDPVEFVRDLLDRAEEGEFDSAGAAAAKAPRAGESGARGLVEEAVLHQVLDMMACKAAVKAGDQMGAEELAALLARREEIERSSNCPHGRPTTIRLTLRELEKQFKRV
jgi:DNA mismatch repair protein MutL